MKKTYKMIDLECAACAAKMENKIAALDGVESVSISFMTGKITIATDDRRHNEIMKKAAKICKSIEPDCTISF